MDQRCMHDDATDPCFARASREVAGVAMCEKHALRTERSQEERIAAIERRLDQVILNLETQDEFGIELAYEIEEG